MKVSFLGHCFPQWPSRLGKRRWRTQRNTTTVTQERGKCNNSIGSEGKCQQYTKHKGESERERKRDRGGGTRGGSNSITSVSSFTGQRDRDAELWTTNEISKSWVRYLPPSQSLADIREVREGEGWRCAQRKPQGHSWTHTHTHIKRLRVGNKRQKTFHPLLWAEECAHDLTRYRALRENTTLHVSYSLCKLHTPMIVSHSGVSPVWRLCSPADRATLKVSQQTTETLETCNRERFDLDTEPIDEDLQLVIMLEIMSFNTLSFIPSSPFIHLECLMR